MFKILLLYLLSVNAVTFIIYGADKRKAVKGKWRIPENTLIGLAVIGGSIGALAGMKIFHHKTLKPKFSIGVPVILFVHVILVLYIIGRLEK